MTRGMQSYLKTSTLGNEIRMIRKVKPQLGYLIVEGEADEKFFKNLVNLRTCKIHPIKGKPNVVSAIESINRQKIEGVMAIIDSDFDNILKKNTYSENVLVTDTHDIETLILKTDNIDKILNEYSNYDKLVELDENKKISLLDRVLNIAQGIGKLRLASERQGLNLDFKELKYEDFIDEELELNYKELTRQVAYNSCKGKEILIIEEHLQDELKIRQDIWQVCCGHDITKILATILSERGFGNSSAQYINGIKLESALRMGYNYSRFFTTELYNAIVDWQGKYKWNLFVGEQVAVAS